MDFEDSTAKIPDSRREGKIEHLLVVMNRNGEVISSKVCEDLDEADAQARAWIRTSRDYTPVLQWRVKGG